jgi:antitoxin HigA-1
MSGRELAVQLDVSPSTLSRILNQTSRVTPEMALRLSKALGRSAESWLAMQDAHDLWVARQQLDLSRVGQIAWAS